MIALHSVIEVEVLHGLGHLDAWLDMDVEKYVQTSILSLSDLMWRDLATLDQFCQLGQILLWIQD